MSDEDRDVDIESDEDDDLLGASTSGGATNFMTQAEKRAHHNALERKRRDHIKESFHSLRDSIPSLQGEKVSATQASRAQILKQATDYIQYMTKKNSTHQQDIDDLKKQNTVLEQQVRALEKAKAANNFATQSVSLDGKVMKANGPISRFHDDSESETSDSEDSRQKQNKNKKLKTK